MSHPEPVARGRYDLVEPVGLIPYLADEPNAALTALGLRNYWTPTSPGGPRRSVGTCPLK